MRSTLQLAALLFLPLAGAASAQIHSPQVNLPRRHAPEDLSWLVQYTQPSPDGSENKLVWDPRFEPLLRRELKAPQSFWGKDKPLSKVALEYLGGPPGRVLLDNTRYLTADACVQHFCPNRGLLWVDLGLPKPLVVFAAVDWISDNRATEDKGAAYTMWVFSGQPLDPAHLPAALVRSIARWTAVPSSGSTDLQNITRVILVDADGAPHTLSPSSIGAHNALPAETGLDTSPQTNNPQQR